MITRRPAWAFSAQNARQTLTKHFGTAGLEGFGFGDGAADAQAIRAAGAVLDYLAETQKARSRTSTGSCPTGPRGRWRSTNRAAAAWRSIAPSATAAAKGRCSGCWTGRRRPSARGCWPSGSPIRSPTRRRSAGGSTRSRSFWATRRWWPSCRNCCAASTTWSGCWPA